MRFYRITFVAGLACGFVAGTAAGRERYDQMVKFARTIAEHPAVQQAASNVQAQATGLASTAAQKVGGQLHDKVPQLASNAMHTVGDKMPGKKNQNGHGKSAASGKDSSFSASHNGHR
jgi:hypothetical protein